MEPEEEEDEVGDHTGDEAEPEVLEHPQKWPIVETEKNQPWAEESLIHDGGRRDTNGRSGR